MLYENRFYSDSEAIALIKKQKETIQQLEARVAYLEDIRALADATAAELKKYYEHANLKGV